MAFLTGTEENLSPERAARLVKEAKNVNVSCNLHLRVCILMKSALNGKMLLLLQRPKGLIYCYDTRCMISNLDDLRVVLRPHLSMTAETPISSTVSQSHFVVLPPSPVSASRSMAFFRCSIFFCFLSARSVFSSVQTALRRTHSIISHPCWGPIFPLAALFLLLLSQAQVYAQGAENLN